ncbi:MAG: thiol protease/hemagglutinin PrtT [Candidatus Azobacteroides sp.]|nr:thiol protease/hemagglutinin PrtT [Candidatus Azobacteroides sp.]
MKTVIFTLSFFLFFSYSFSETITVDQALLVAKAFYQKERILRNSNQAGLSELSLSYTCTDEKNDSSALFYVFSKTHPAGFIFIAGDDRAKSVLGYSDDNRTFDMENLPDNFKNWMEQMKVEMQWLRKNESSSREYISVQTNQNQSFAPFISPLLGELSWGQDEPYNDLCPMDGKSRSKTGCVATAMAQIMWYHHWPARGQGEHNYISRTRGFNLSSDFSQSQYNWNLMYDPKTAKTTETAKRAVAQLMYDCGVSLDMDYTSSLSSTYSESVPYALNKYFNYDKNMQVYYRRYFSCDEWENLLKKELNNRLPVYFSGENSITGHAYVCDGYDSENLFHLNWGWEGNNNGYFAICAYNSKIEEAGYSFVDYTNSQMIVTGIQPPTANSKASYNIYLEQRDFTTLSSTIQRNDYFIINASSLSNQGINPFDGQVGIGLYQNNDLIEVFSIKSMQCESFEQKHVPWSSLQIPNDIEPGVYEFCPVYKGFDENDWSIIRSEGSISNHLGLAITATSIQFFMPIDAKAQLYILPSGFSISALYQDSPAKFNLHIGNKGKDAYSLLGVCLKDESGKQELVASQGIGIHANDILSVELSAFITVKEGKYSAYPCYEADYTWISFDSKNEQAVVVLPPLKGSPDLSFEIKPQFYFLPVENDNFINISSSIKNKGIPTKGDMYAIVYSLDNSSYWEYHRRTLAIMENETVPFDIQIPVKSGNGNYYISFQYKDQKDYVKYFDESSYFSIKDNPSFLSEINSKPQWSIYPDPADQYIIIDSQIMLKSIRIIGLTGQTFYWKQFPKNTFFRRIAIDNLNPSIYLLQIETEQGRDVKKFTKN